MYSEKVEILMRLNYENIYGNILKKIKIILDKAMPF